MNRRRHRPLTEEELALWRHVTQDVVRADRRRPEPPPNAPEPAPVKPAPRHPPRLPHKHAPVRRFEVAGYTPPVSAPRLREDRVNCMKDHGFGLQDRHAVDLAGGFGREIEAVEAWPRRVGRDAAIDALRLELGGGGGLGLPSAVCCHSCFVS